MDANNLAALRLDLLNVGDLQAILSQFPAIIQAVPGGKELKAAAWALEQHLESTNPVEISLGPIHVRWRQFPVEARQGILTTLFGPPDAETPIPSLTDAAATLLALVPPIA
jgi:hypothetical protein